MRRLRLSLRAWQRLLSRIDANFSCLNWQTRSLYWLSGAGHLLLGRIQETRYANELKAAVPSPPIFLLGFWRSGTTFLHELFCSDTRFGFPSTYACMNPAHFLLTEKAFPKGVAKQQTRRPMDNMQYSWTSPQEDEFALLCMGAPSPYEALLVPSLMSNPRVLLDLRCRSGDEQGRWAQMLQLFLRLLTVQQDKTMMLKSPTHGFRLPLLTSLFPKARFVIIERNPYEVFASNLKLWQTLLDRYSLESTSSEQIESFVLAAYLIHEEAITEGIPSLGPGKVSRVRYEDVVADPLGHVKRIYSDLGLAEFEAARPALEQHIASVSGYQRNRLLLSKAQK